MLSADPFGQLKKPSKMFSADPFRQQKNLQKKQIIRTTELRVIANAKLGVRANAELGVRANAELGVIASVRTLQKICEDITKKIKKI